MKEYLDHKCKECEEYCSYAEHKCLFKKCFVSGADEACPDFVERDKDLDEIFM